MGHQETVFVKSEGDKWLERNKDKPYIDYVGLALRDIDLRHSAIIEIGSGRGDCIGNLQKRANGLCVGIDPSPMAQAISHERFPNVDFMRGTATALPCGGNDFDLVIYSFCLYLCDREDLLFISSEGDRLLQDKGHLVIHDFDPEYPHRVLYRHVNGLFSYKQDYSKLWLANPAYALVSKTVIADGSAVWVLRKDIVAGWPLEAAS